MGFGVTRMNSKTQTNLKSKLLTSLGLISLILSPVLLGSTASAKPFHVEAKPTSDFTSCVDRQKTGAVIILMDESVSVYKSDSMGNRLQGVQIFIDELADLATDHQAKVKVRLAGMGAAYKVRSGGDSWQTLEKGSDSTVQSLKDSAAGSWQSKTSNGFSNKSGNDIWGALDNAKQDFNSQSDISCKLLLFFKDGEDWQYFARDDSKVKLPEAQELREEGDFHGADEIAAEDICRNLGVADSLRSADIYTVVAALGSGSPEKFGKLEALAVGSGADGTSCGDQPAKGDFIQVENATRLQQDFATLLDSNITILKGSREFRLSPGLTSIRIVSSAVTDSYKIVPPTQCSNNGAKKVDVDSESTGTFGQAVNWKKINYGASASGVPSSLRIVIHHEMQSKDFSCWSGQWKIVASPNTLTSIKFDANLKAVVKFNEGDGFNPVLFPGKSQKFKVILQRIDDPALVLTPGDINSDLDYEARATLYSPDGEEIDTLFDSGSYGGLLPKSAFFEEDQTLNIDKKWGIGTDKIRVVLNVRVLDSDLLLNPMQTETPVIVGNLIKAPTVTQVVSLGTISGASASHGVLKVHGGDKDACILLDRAKVNLTAAPVGVNYSLSGECVKIPANENVDVPFNISPIAGSKGAAVGAVDGTFKFQAQLIDSTSTLLDMPAVSFHGYQDAAPNDAARWALIVLFMGLSGLFAYLLLIALSKYVARFPTQHAVRQLHLQSLAVPIRVARYEIKSAEESSIEKLLDDIDRPTWVNVEKNRRAAISSGVRLESRSSGLRLASAGYAESTGQFVGIGGPAVAGAPHENKQAIIGLGLQNTWMILFSEAELIGKVADDNFAAIGQLILIIDANAPIEKKMQLSSSAEAALGQQLPKLIELANRKPEQKKSSGEKTKSVKNSKAGKKAKEESSTDSSSSTPQQTDPWAFGTPSTSQSNSSSSASTNQPSSKPTDDPWSF
jgi:hypothetical protein